MGSWLPSRGSRIRPVMVELEDRVVPNAVLNLHDDIYRIATLPATTVTQTGTSELHLTGTGDPLAGSVVNLNSPDAWLFLDNIPPSAVSSTFLNRVNVNNAAAVFNTNVRVVQYAQGTVVIPHAANFTPLQVYTESNFGGTSTALSQYTAYNVASLGAFNQTISSFKLKRGYTATVAQNENGTGLSRNYVAQDGDLLVPVLPAALDNSIEFVRVFPWRWTSKKGIAGNIGQQLQTQWMYNWNIDQNSSLDREYVAIRQQRWWPGLNQNWQTRGVNHLLGYNEPDQASQANIAVGDAIWSWPDLLGTGLRVGAPAVSDGGLSWLYSFMDQADAQGLRVDFVPVHYYRSFNPADPAGAATQFYNYLKGIYDQVQRPLWVTEWNNGANWTADADPTSAQQQAAVAAMVAMLENTPFVERYSIYNWVEDVRRVQWDDPAGSLTLAGETYRDTVSKLSYRQELPEPAGTPDAVYSFEGNASDTSGNGHSALQAGARSFTPGQQGQAIALDGQNDSVQLSPGLGDSLDFTFAGWVKWNGGASWQRVFDLGWDTSKYMFLTPKSSGGTLRFAIKDGGSEQQLNAAAALPVGVWTHVAVTISGTTGKLFVNGEVAATNAAMTINPADVNTSYNYLGKSRFSADPLLSGALDEVRFSGRALSDSEIATLALRARDPSFETPATATYVYQPGGTLTQTPLRQVEKLNRGIVAVRRSTTQAYIGWRLLGTDPATVGFNLYRTANGGTPVKLTATPLTLTTDFTDGTVNFAAANAYYVRPVIAGVEGVASESFTLAANPTIQQRLTIPLQIPAPGPDYTYEANDASVGDLDGDGQYEVIVKWNPSNAHDNAQSGTTGNVYLDAYRMDGQRLWRVDLGRNIRAGAHYTQFMVYDFDGDGKAEVVTKTAPGTIDGLGVPVLMGSDLVTADYRNASGYILTGPEYLTAFRGLTGAALSTIPFEPARGTVSQWGDTYGNRVDRFTAAVAYLDGARPSLVFGRGYYGPQSSSGQARNEIAAYDFRNGQLTLRWHFKAGHNINNNINTDYIGEGAHSVTVGDVDGDGRDEIVYGAAVIDDNGTGLYATGLGHGDALHMSDMDPSRPGLEVFMTHEGFGSHQGVGGEFRDAATGELISSIYGSGDVGRGVAADIDPNSPGYEMWATADDSNIYSAAGVALYDAPSNMFNNFVVWWDGDLSRELLDGTTISDWSNPGRANFDLDPGTSGSQIYAPGASSNNGTKSTPALSADLFGDWREEVMWRRSDNSALDIFTTIIPAQNRLTTLMHDTQYRTAIAWQNTGYNQPPHPSFFLGTGMAAPPPPKIFLAGDAGLTITPVNSTSTSAGGAVTFTVSLKTLPASNVVLAIASSDTTQATAGPAALTFTPANWQTPQTVTVTRINGGQFATITVSVNDAASADAYDPVADRSLTFTGATWTYTGSQGNGSGVSANASAFTSGNSPAPHGSQVAFLQSNASISQTISGLEPGRTYQVTFAASQRQNRVGGQAGQTFDLRINGITVGSFEPLQTLAAYTDFTVSFIAAAATHLLSFHGTNLHGGDNTAFLDRVRIRTINGAPTANAQLVIAPMNTSKTVTLTASDPESQPLTYTITQAPQHGTLSGTVPYLTYTPANGHFGDDSFQFKANDGAADSNTAMVSITVVAPPSVTAFSVNSTSVQRSRVTSVTVKFQNPVPAAFLSGLGAITLTRTLGGPATVVQTGATGANGLITPAQNGPNSLILTFSNANGAALSAGVENGSLSDGYWRLSIPSAGNFQTTLRRLFGDIDNNGTVNSQDFAEFGNLFGTTVPDNPFDFNGDGTIGSADFAEFGARFGVTL